MIHFYAARNFLWTITKFIDKWAPSLATSINPVAYDSVRLNDPVPPGVHLFTDFERLLPPEFAFARRLHTRLSAHPDSYRSLNDPADWTGRFGLLHDLAEAGINDFRAYRLPDAGASVRFPAFLRWENEHSGSLGGPVHSMAELRQQVKDKVSPRRKLLSRYLMVVEQMDARSDDGLYRKYSAMNIGDRLIPRHVLFSKDWVTKTANVVNESTVEEERDFIENFPHAAQLREVFRLAGLRYGRIDYGFSNGRLQVWEINTNPVLVPRPGAIDRLRRPLQRESAQAISEAFEALVRELPAGPGHRVFGLPERMRWQGQASFSRKYDRYRR